jgi:isoquinoline 1-oxidoreductase alpha subunit
LLFLDDQINQSCMPKYKLQVNGKVNEVDVASDTPLLWVLRDHMRLVGTKYGCGIGQCGACTVHMDGVATKSCLLPVSSIETSKITTIEGLSEKGDHPLQQAWDEVDVPQCGYCQAGQIMTAAALLKQNPHPTMDEIEGTMHGNICRCGAYHRIREAIKLASSKK